MSDFADPKPMRCFFCGAWHDMVSRRYVESHTTGAFICERCILECISNIAEHSRLNVFSAKDEAKKD